MEPFEDDRFVATLESLRPEPSEEFAAQLDERAAAGFPRREGGRESRWSRLRAHLSGFEPRRLVLPAGAVAVAAIAVATVVAVSSGGSGGSAAVGTVSELSAPPPSSSSGEEAAATEAEPSSSASAGGTAGAGAESGEVLKPSGGTRLSSSDAASATGPYAAGAKHRSVERGAEITLGTEPDKVGDAAGKVLDTVHQYDGIVLDSSVSGGSEGEAKARFTLLIPSAKLADALADLSGIAEVRSRHESSKDITAPTVTVGEQLQDSHARVQSLLNQLAEAETEAEQEAVEAKLASARRQQARLKAQLSALQRRANLSRVSLKIVSDEAPASSGGGWDAGSALHEAGHILSVAAGVVIVALAVLAPLALLALLAWLAHRAWLRGRRERALG
jgi:Domain of unknown function (DUF4349)